MAKAAEKMARITEVFIVLDCGWLAEIGKVLVVGSGGVIRGSSSQSSSWVRYRSRTDS
jgi:hypothetical protein